jgi:chromate transporter
MSLHGFAACCPGARRAIVEEKRWMTAQEFNEAFAVAQFLPGANVINLAVFGFVLIVLAPDSIALAAWMRR